MVQYSRTRFDASFAALSDATRRGVLEQLGRADASITDLAEKFHMTLTGMKKHVGVLEQAGLVTTEKVGRVRTCKLGLRRLEEEAAWGAVVFDTKPVPFAVRKPLADLNETDRLGWGVAIWFGCDDADALHDHLIEHGTPIVFAPKDGPFGRYFAFRDPFGYTITPHTVAQS